MKVLGVSGSPIHNSNTDRALKIALEATGAKKIEFIKLSDYQIAPCNACLSCIQTNHCIIKDDGIALAEKAYKADALIIAGFSTYSTLDSRTKTFIERLYPLGHRHGLMSDKPGAAIITSAIPNDMADQAPTSENCIKAIKNYMMAEGMKFVGSVSINGNMPCIKCGDSGQCRQSSLPKIHGPNVTVESININDLDDNPETIAALKKLGNDLTECFYGG